MTWTSEDCSEDGYHVQVISEVDLYVLGISRDKPFLFRLFVINNMDKHLADIILNRTESFSIN